MKLLITLRTAQASEYLEPRQAISQDWIHLCQRFNFTPILVPFGLEDYEPYFALNPNGLLLTGGDNVGPLTNEPDGLSPTLRDICESRLIELALQNQLPILGVCRGMQMLNVFFGGTITRKLETNHIGEHDILFVKPKWQYQPGDKVSVNSFHHSGIYRSQLAANFEAIAQSEEGCIEYMEHQQLPITGILWHPERKNKAAYSLDEKIILHRFKR